MLEVSYDTREVQRFLLNWNKQVRFGVMKGLNDLILRFQRVQRAHQRRQFTYSGSSGERYWHQGVKIPRQRGFATKADPFEARSIWLPKSRKGGDPKYDIFERQQFGQKRTPIGHRKKLAIPDEDVPRTGGGQIQARFKPAKLKERTAAFIVPFGADVSGLFIRHRRGSKRHVTAYSQRASGGGRKLTLRNDPNVDFLYLLVKSAKVDAVYDYYKNAERVIRLHGSRVMARHLVNAFRTARF